jgi:hypothetical protein
MQAKRDHRCWILPKPAIELTAIRQRRKSRSQVVLGIAVKGSFAWKLRPLSKQGQRHDFTARQCGCWAWMTGFIDLVRLAKIIDHNVQYRYKGVHIYHRELLL